MTTDERLDRLTERTDAIAESVELLAADIRGLTAEMRTRFGETLGFINRLAHVAEIHERRLDEFDKGRQ